MPAKYTPEQCTAAFWAKVNKDGPVSDYAPDLGECWLWTGSRTRNGYGQFLADARKTRLAHHFLRGKAPDGLQWDHLCRVRACVRPSHLEAVTPSENTQRGASGGLITHCPQGHAYDSANTYFWRGWRNCRTCRSERQRQRQLV